MADEIKFTFDLNRIKYSEILAFKEDDPDAGAKTVDIMARSCTSWPYKGDVSVDAIMEMGLADFVDMQAAFNDVMEELFRKIKGNK
jgi:hypothetical protein